MSTRTRKRSEDEAPEDAVDTDAKKRKVEEVEEEEEKPANIEEKPVEEVAATKDDTTEVKEDGETTAENENPTAEGDADAPRDHSEHQVDAPGSEMLNCRDCPRQFEFSKGEQEFYAMKGFTNKPSRCRECKEKKKQEFESRNMDRGFGGNSGGRGVCFTFQRTGSCRYGDTCRFSHEGGNTRGGDDRGSYGNNGRRDYGNDRPRGVCFSFQRGQCNYGDRCRFSHEGGSGGNDRGSYGNDRGSYGNDRPKGVCFDFQRGNCNRGDGCRFSHSGGGGGGGGGYGNQDKYDDRRGGERDSNRRFNDGPPRDYGRFNAGPQNDDNNRGEDRD